MIFVMSSKQSEVSSDLERKVRWDCRFVPNTLGEA